MLFKDFYNEFVLVEGVMDQVPRKLLKTVDNVQYLPDKAPYGFWVDRSGNFREVPMYGHEEAAQEMLTTSSKYLAKKDIPFPIQSIYRGMYAEGWIRVVFGSAYLLYQTGDANKTASHSQMKFLNFMKEFYEKILEKDD